MNSPKWKLSKWKPCNMVTRFYLSFIFATNRTYTETCYLVWTLEICFQYNASFKLGRTKYTFLHFFFFCLLYIIFHLTLFFVFDCKVHTALHSCGPKNSVFSYPLKLTAKIYMKTNSTKIIGNTTRHTRSNLDTIRFCRIIFSL